MDALWVKDGALEVCDGALFHAPAPENCVCGDADCCQTTVSLPDLTTVDPDDVITGLDPLFVVVEEERAANLEAEAGSVVIAGSFSVDWYFVDNQGQLQSGTALVDMSGTWPDDYDQPFTGGATQSYTGNAGCGLTMFANAEKSYSADGASHPVGLTVLAQQQWNASLEKWFLRVEFQAAAGAPGNPLGNGGVSVLYDMADGTWGAPSSLADPGAPGSGSLQFSITHLTNFVRFSIDGLLTNRYTDGTQTQIQDFIANNVRVNIHKDWLDFCSDPQSWSVPV